jgi:hypothetical protein
MFADGTARQYRLLVEDGQLVDRPFGQVATALIGAFDELLVHWLLTEPRTPPQDLLPWRPRCSWRSSPAARSGDGN